MASSHPDQHEPTDRLASLSDALWTDELWDDEETLDPPSPDDAVDREDSQLGETPSSSPVAPPAEPARGTGAGRCDRDGDASGGADAATPDGKSQAAEDGAVEVTARFVPPISLDVLPDRPQRPARRPGVRPAEQRREFRADGAEHEVRTVVPRSENGNGRADRGRVERHLDVELAKLDRAQGTIGVMSCAGGVGKSTIALALADTLQRTGHGPVALVDCDAELAGLSILAGGGGQMTRLISDPDDDAESHATILPSGVALYGTGHHAPILELMMRRPEIIRQIRARLREEYPVVILDAGAGMQHPIAHTVAELSDLAVLVTRATIAATAGLVYTYRQLRASRAFVDSESETTGATDVLAVVNNVTRRQEPDLAVLVPELHRAGLDPLVLAADDGIEQSLEDGGYTLPELPVDVRVAVKRLVVSTIDTLEDGSKRNMRLSPESVQCW